MPCTIPTCIHDRTIRKVIYPFKVCTADPGKKGGRDEGYYKVGREGGWLGVSDDLILVAGMEGGG